MQQVDLVNDQQPDNLCQGHISCTLPCHHIPLLWCCHQHLWNHSIFGKIGLIWQQDEYRVIIFTDEKCRTCWYRKILLKCLTNSSLFITDTCLCFHYFCLCKLHISCQFFDGNSKWLKTTSKVSNHLRSKCFHWCHIHYLIIKIKNNYNFLLQKL